MPDISHISSNNPTVPEQSAVEAIKHPPHQEGSRQHVLSWSNLGRHCSEPNCEINLTRDDASHDAPTYEVIERLEAKAARLADALKRINAARFAPADDLREAAYQALTDTAPAAEAHDK